MTDTPTFTARQRVTINLDNEVRPGRLTISHEPGRWFAIMADGTHTGEISEDRIQAVTTLRHGDRLRIVNAMAQNHTVSTLSGYGAEYNDYDGPTGMGRYFAALERNSGKNVWLTAEAIVIGAPREPSAARHYVRIGDVVWLDSITPGEGGWYRIDPPGAFDNDHCRLVRG